VFLDIKLRTCVLRIDIVQLLNNLRISAESLLDIYFGFHFSPLPAFKALHLREPKVARKSLGKVVINIVRCE
jgi:hypothetical protein